MNHLRGLKFITKRAAKYRSKAKTMPDLRIIDVGFSLSALQVICEVVNAQDVSTYIFNFTKKDKVKDFAAYVKKEINGSVLNADRIKEISTYMECLQ